MVKRKKLGLLYQYNENWIGGTYYIQNLISALGYLENEEQPEIFIITNDVDEFEKLKNKVNYPYLNYVHNYHHFSYSVSQKIINKVCFYFFKKRIFNKYKSFVDYSFPFGGKNEKQIGKQMIYWIPDFQEHYLPHFFTTEEIEQRKINQTFISNQTNKLILSSQNALNSYLKFYPDNTTTNIVLPFAVVNENTPELHKDILLAKYKLPNNFFISPNQFWVHKNHLIILQAISELNKMGINVNIVFTGKEYDYRNPTYFETLKTYVQENDLTNQVWFLGFIDRGDQINLIRYSKAVIQPSLFEGWSTVVEDAKSLNKIIILSSIQVHKEQLNGKGQFFNPTNAVELATKISEVNTAIEHSIDYDYTNQIKLFAKNFMQILN